MIQQGTHVYPFRRFLVCYLISESPMLGMLGRNSHWSASFACQFTREMLQYLDPGPYWLMQCLFRNISTCQMTLKEINEKQGSLISTLDDNTKGISNAGASANVRRILSSPFLVSVM